MFGYSDEDGTEAATYDGKLDEDEMPGPRRARDRLVEELTAQRAEERIGEDGRGARREPSTDGDVEGRAAHQGPEVDGTTYLVRAGRAAGRRPGARASVVGTDGVDLVADAREL